MSYPHRSFKSCLVCKFSHSSLYPTKTSNNIVRIFLMISACTIFCLRTSIFCCQ